MIKLGKVSEETKGQKFFGLPEFIGGEPEFPL